MTIAFADTYRLVRRGPQSSIPRYRGKPPAEGGFGFFAVNPWRCGSAIGCALRPYASQAAICRRFTLDELKQYEKLRRLSPECIVED